MDKVDRAELEKALDEGCTVDVLERSYKRKSELPKGDDIEGVVIRDAQGRLTREGMELTIERGGSVLLSGEQDPIVHKDHLPSPAELARGDEKKAQQVRDSLLSQRAHLDGELAKLDTPRESSGAITPAPPHTPPHAPTPPLAPQRRPGRREDT